MLNICFRHLCLGSRSSNHQRGKQELEKWRTAHAAVGIPAGSDCVSFSALSTIYQYHRWVKAQFWSTSWPEVSCWSAFASFGAPTSSRGWLMSIAIAWSSAEIQHNSYRAQSFSLGWWTSRSMSSFLAFLFAFLNVDDDGSFRSSWAGCFFQMECSCLLPFWWLSSGCE